MLGILGDKAEVTSEEILPKHTACLTGEGSYLLPRSPGCHSPAPGELRGPVGPPEGGYLRPLPPSPGECVAACVCLCMCVGVCGSVSESASVRVTVS